VLIGDRLEAIEHGVAAGVSPVTLKPAGNVWRIGDAPLHVNNAKNAMNAITM